MRTEEDTTVSQKHPWSVRVALLMINVYQRTLSPDHGLFSQVTMYGCKYRPTCSQYTYTAIEQYGIIRGSAMGAIRIVKCNPFSAGGYDPVPTAIKQNDNNTHV